MSFLTPVLNFNNEYCREDCIKCTEACPSGALNRLSLEDKSDVKLGLPEIDMNECLLGYDKECSACQSACPHDAVEFEFSYASYSLTVKVDPQKCIGCGACETACPAIPVKAIIIISL
ncbi:MAG: 4Fe-4S dicluster domain-containing protein [Bacteroidales bacterium]|nr:4Fe-4S dicluster domain-containing protein [Bacteroidales bacterium]